MFGENLKRGVDNSGQLQVQSVFDTIQGEGPFAGMPAVFVRLTGCNLQCWFCDTVWDDALDKWYEPAHVMGDVLRAASHRTKAPLVVITGGEPTRFGTGLNRLIEMLLAQGCPVQIETAGTFWHDIYADERVAIVVAPKLAKVHPKIREHAAAWKYVIIGNEVDASDGLPSGSTQRKNVGAPARPPTDFNVHEIYLQPCDQYDAAKNASNMGAMVASCLRFGYTAGTQMHKQIGVE